MPRKINFILIIVGGGIALYANAEEEQDLYILILGILILMIGLYRLSRGLSSKSEDDDGDYPQKNVRF